MLSSDSEVEKYLGFTSNPCRTFDSGRSCAVTPGRLKKTAAAGQNDEMKQSNIKRPASACDFITNSKTPCRLPKTPKKIYAAKKKTPCKTPASETDRYIPSRNLTNFSSGHHRILKFSECGAETEISSDACERSQIKKKNMTDNFHQLLGEVNDKRILQFDSPIKRTPTKAQTLYAPSSCSSSKKKHFRSIPRSAEKVLDAPGYIDDYYLNLLHWSHSLDLVAVALGQSVYIWTPSSFEIKHLCQLNDPDDQVTSVQWVQEGPNIAVGMSSGYIQLWDVEKKKRLRQMPAHSSRVSVLAWNGPVLTSGSRGGSIHNHDVRISEHHISSYIRHQQEVCGLQWSPSGRYLASGCNSNLVAVWDSNISGVRLDPLHQFNDHRAAVKAVAWCPWQHNILASGGGVADKTIRFWNVNNGSCLNTVNTKSQVSSVIWNEEHRELISGHGYPDNQLTIWSYSDMERKANLLGHTGRVLQLALSPDHTRILSAAADETLRLWHCFQATNVVDNKKKTMARDTILSMTTIR